MFQNSQILYNITFYTYFIFINFNMYINKLMIKLMDTKVVCYVDGVCITMRTSITNTIGGIYETFTLYVSRTRYYVSEGVIVWGTTA